MSDKYTITLHGKDHRVRFKAARGIEVRQLTQAYWHPLTGDQLMSLDHKGLRTVADCMEATLKGERDE